MSHDSHSHSLLSLSSPCSPHLSPSSPPFVATRLLPMLRDRPLSLANTTSVCPSIPVSPCHAQHIALASCQDTFQDRISPGLHLSFHLTLVRSFLFLCPRPFSPPPIPTRTMRSISCIHYPSPGFGQGGQTLITEYRELSPLSVCVHPSQAQVTP